MSGTTGKGLHYPVAGDAVGGVAATVQTLAQDVDTSLGERQAVVIDPPSVAAFAATNLNVGVPGAEIGNHVILTYNPAGLTAGVVLSAGVSAADVVTIRVQNCTNAAVNPVAITVYICALPFSGVT